ncbi:hypothetical protein N5T90_09865 [Aliarcobacter cryaerophilus]|uniref:plasmid mobilization protein n=1 Tax=Aliarcobacter cryaerophilus TaxID=28198 RepID=UPI0021B68A3B|nr:hypothetical protein [Aliarcobacter cryaerophilus]MCT7471182.1 hypothetical protein [Aliarcobacter cryaerophilus]
MNILSFGSKCFILNSNKLFKSSVKKVLNPKGRPKLELDELKQEQIVIYLTKEQKDEITKKAKQSSLSVSKYVMLKVFGIN